MVAEVLIEYSAKAINKTFDYLIPFNMQKSLKKGHKVKVPFGRVEVEGFVLNIKNTQENIDYKTIKEITNPEFYLNEELINLGKFLENKTSANLISCYQVMLPKAYKAKSAYNLSKKFINYISLVNPDFNIDEYIENNKRNKGEHKILLALKNNTKILKKEYGITSVKALINKKIIKEIKEEENRLKSNNKNTYNINLTEEQKKVYEEIISEKTNNTMLLFGVTGSGKTEVYIKIIEKAIKQNKTAIFLVPEISLTPQIVDRFIYEFGDSVAILHSSLSEGEKFDEYRRILNNEVRVVIGARSAIFAPLKNIGIIIIDEEHSPTYKQENNPRYNTIEIAKERCIYNNAKLILGSATPSLESYARALKGVYKLLELKTRVNKKEMPKIELIDMNKELKKRNFIISDTLKNKIQDKLNKNEQIIILLNRRGYSTFINCSNCGYVYKCPNCDITLTYHKSSKALRCHYCGFTKYADNVCPDCKEESLNNLGLGTEKLEQLISETFKEAKVMRMDADTTTKKGAHEKLIESFKNQEADILIGTQMISKGLNFPNVTLVGVLNADTALNLPDFRSGEKAFQLFMQTAGRTGRHDKTGEVVIETFNPDNYVLKYVKNYDYEGFFKHEMNIRKILKYPPYFYITNIKIVSNTFEESRDESKKVSSYLSKQLNNNYIILGPTTAGVFKMNNKYRFSILIKYKTDELLLETLKELLEIYSTNKKVNIEVDHNPISMI